MATGDLKNNLRKLVSELKQVHFPQRELDLKGIAQGLPKAFLPVLHHVFLDYSISLAEYFAAKEYDLYGKTDLRFLEAVYKVLRDEFGYKPQVTKEQFLTIGFAERKIISLCAILKLLREKHSELNPKSSKSEKVKEKISQPINGGTTRKENSSGINNDYFPGPLPVDTDMKRFRSNRQAMEAGLGLKEPLVKRMVSDGDPEFEGNIKPLSERAGGSVSSHKNREQFKQGSNSTDPSFPSNLIVKTSCEEGRFGVKFPVSRNAEIRSNLCRQPPVFTLGREESNFPTQPQKTVTWEDQAKDSQDRHIKPSEEIPNALPLSTEPVTPISVPARIHSIPYSTISPTYPLELETAVRMAAVPHTIPCPVSMTTAPLPSPDLMLTPVVKGAQHGAIPVSSSQSESDLYSGLVSGENFPSTRVVRHSNSVKPVVGEGTAPSNLSVQTEAEVFVLRQLVQDLQEKFDSMVLLNNEMSARVVLLESKMKLLEEACEKKCSCTNESPLLANNKENTSKEDDHIVVSGFNVCSDKASVKEFSADATTNEHSSNTDTNLKTVLKQNSTSRKLFKETELSPTSGDHGVKEPTFTDLTTFSEKSDDEADSGDSQNSEQAAGNGKDVLCNDKDDSVIISPLPSVFKLSGVFKDQSTKNTVVNVHKRLQETRELLARTNRDFAAKFNRYQIE